MTIFRNTLVGITLNVCDRNLPRVSSSLLHVSILHFVIKEIEGRCGECGIKNEGQRLNSYPWFVAIKEKVGDVNVYHTGTLVSKEWVVTAASILTNEPKKENFEAKVGTTAFDLHVANSGPLGRFRITLCHLSSNLVVLTFMSKDVTSFVESDFIVENDWISISAILVHPQLGSKIHKTQNIFEVNPYNVAMMRLRDRISDPLPHPSDVLVDTIQPICLPESDLHIADDQIGLSSRFLTSKEAKILTYHKCYNWSGEKLFKNYGISIQR